MTPSTIQSYLDRKPFRPFKLHLSSGKVLEIAFPGVAWNLRTTLMVFHPAEAGHYASDTFSEINYRSIERIEQLPEPAQSA